MSFRTRLTLFFVAIVIVPMASVAVVLFRLIEDNERGKADARVAARQESAINLYREARLRAGEVAGELGTDGRLSAALRRGETAAAQRRARQLLRTTGAVRIVVRDRRRTRVDVGNRRATAPDIRRIVFPSGRRYGTLEVSVQRASFYARLVERITGAEVVVRSGDRLLSSTLEAVDPGELAASGRLEVRDRVFRAATFEAPGFRGRRQRITILVSDAATDAAVAESRLLAAGLLAGFFALAFAFALLVSRSLQRQIGSFLDAARRLGRGDFSTPVPTHGRDEFAALGAEFNKMASELETRLEELRLERVRLQAAMRRIGETIASNLDRQALLEIGMRTTVDGVAADGGRVSVREEPAGPLVESAREGDAEGVEETVRAVEAAVLETLTPREVNAERASALAHPLLTADDGRRIHGLVSVWRRDHPFSAAERDLFHYLAAQVAVSMENVALHETVRRQAVTDELTGLSNHRRFQDALGAELERSRRFAQPLGLVLLDIDNFKQVNDTYGHQVGDRVLHEVARVLRQNSREIDEPARYGGEELAVILPNTDLEGAFQLAERVREGIAELVFPLPGEAEPLRVTASFGAASVPESAAGHRTLIEAADVALYRAKRAGKNQTVRAERVAAE